MWRAVVQLIEMRTKAGDGEGAAEAQQCLDKGMAQFMQAASQMQAAMGGAGRGRGAGGPSLPMRR